MPEDDEGAVSVIIPARNEELNIERVVRSIAPQRGLRELIVVDDDSTDRTAEILAGLQQEIPLLRTRGVKSLPEGWTGKSHAAAAGAELATGDWLLFTDADTEHLPGSLEAMVDRATAEGAALLSLSPGQQTPTWWEKAIIPFVFVQLAKIFPFEKVSDPASPEAAANGQYLLVRRSVYNEIGGFAAVRREILDDVALARLVKQRGGRLLFLPGAEWVRTRMYSTFRDMWQGWSKNLYLLYGRRPGPLLEALGAALVLDFLLPVGFLVLAAAIALGQDGGWMLTALVVCFAGSVLREWNYERSLTQLGFDVRLGVYQMPGAGLFALLLMNSLWAHKVAGGVQWKGRKYRA
ncbi:MAG TPA: glycosyltransferase family 2 protein [Terriglobia bacterium]|nr:glycosyltransferase family 2 protein [Terriglobia bacterium]